ncbi:MAG: hypothetical protein IKE60_02375 [Reyranella sp.]|uniref:hypothetical protein n=1 Tax=Reyranella sp. TaxID=1929291 RepID=UPI0025D53D14|nr:hypothetical protein [Reyranella sp.]MBR2813468.1 hypothetical protein [Reyranella sp.]
MRKPFSLWGRGAKAKDSAAAADDEEEEETKAEADNDEDDEEEEAKAEAEDEEDEEDEEEDDDEKIEAEASKVSSAVRASIVGGERARIHAIVDGAGADNVAAALHVALNTDMPAKDALGFLKATGSKVPSGGRLGLQRDMAARRQPRIGAAGKTPGAGDEVDALATSVLQHARRHRSDD